MDDLVPVNWTSESLATGGLRQCYEIAARLAYEQGGTFYLGRMAEIDVGYESRAHVLMVGGSRGGKGVDMSATKLDTQKNLFDFSTKPNEASRLAHRHGPGNEYCDGMGKKVVILDATGEAVDVDEFKRWINPIGGPGGFIDPESDDAVERADRLAFCVKPAKAGEANTYFPNDMRNLFSKVCLHVASDPLFEGRRNILTVASLIRVGDVDTYDYLLDNEDPSIAIVYDEKGNPMDDPLSVLFQSMAMNPAFNGVVAEAGIYFLGLRETKDQFRGVHGECVATLAFLNSPKLQRVFCGEPEDEFDFMEYKTNPQGVACFFTLEESLIETAGAAPRMAFAMLEAALKKPGGTASGRKNLIWLDEFGALKRMDTIEHGAASIAGYSGGCQLVMIVQSLAQLASERAYGEKGLRVLLSGCPLKIFLDIREEYTAKIIKEMLGEKEVVTLNRSEARGRGTQQSDAYGLSQAYTDNWGANAGGSQVATANADQSSKERTTASHNHSRSGAHNRASSKQRTTGKNENETATITENRTVRPVLGIDEIIDRYAAERIGTPLALVNIAGIGWLEIERVRFWENPLFYRKFGRDPDHEFIQAPKPSGITSPKPALLSSSKKRDWTLRYVAGGCLIAAVAGAGPVAFVGLLLVPLIRGFKQGLRG